MSKLNILKTLGSRILDLIFPKKCSVCKSIFPFGSLDKGLCDNCILIFKKPVGNICKQCGKETENKYCYVCARLLNGKISKDTKFYFTKNYTVFKYNDATKELIFDLKYEKNLVTLEAFEKLIALRLKELDFSNVDLIIPVPMYIKKERKRGFNQAKLFAKIIAKLTKIEYTEKAIIRNRETSVQSNKSLKHRHENLENCFSVINDDLILNKVILLVDDIYTSGSTINTASKELMNKGAREVISFTISTIEEKIDENF